MIAIKNNSRSEILRGIGAEFHQRMYTIQVKFKYVCQSLRPNCGKNKKIVFVIYILVALLLILKSLFLFSFLFNVNASFNKYCCRYMLYYYVNW